MLHGKIRTKSCGSHDAVRKKARMVMLSLFRFPDGKKSVVVRHLKVVGDIFCGTFLVGFLEKKI